MKQRSKHLHKGPEGKLHGRHHLAVEMTEPGAENEQQRNEVAERAFTLWQQAGRPAGRDAEFWLKAEQELESEHEHKQ